MHGICIHTFFKLMINALTNEYGGFLRSSCCLLIRFCANLVLLKYFQYYTQFKFTLNLFTVFSTNILRMLGIKTSHNHERDLPGAQFSKGKYLSTVIVMQLEF